MGPDFFVAGRWRNRDAIAAVLQVLDDAGLSSYCFVRNTYSGALDGFGDSDDPEGLVTATEAADLDDPRIEAIFEADLAAQRPAQRFLIVMPAGVAAHMEAGISYAPGKPCYAIGPVEKTETLYRVFHRLFTGPEDLTRWLTSPGALIS